LIASTLLSGLPKILAIKLFAMSVDFICAFFTYKIVKLKYPVGKMANWAFLAVILSPTVIYNSSLWGQCDVIYTTGLIACVYFLSIHKQIPALMSFGLALSFKLQAMFLAPLLLTLLSFLFIRNLMLRTVNFLQKNYQIATQKLVNIFPIPVEIR
jgi:Gpi18-like mannosyltransferase